MKNSTLDEILKKICCYYGVKESDVKRETRKKEIVKARQVFFYLARVYTKKSLQRIVMFVNHKDHSNAIYAVNKITDFIHIYPDFKKEILELSEDNFIRNNKSRKSFTKRRYRISKKEKTFLSDKIKLTSNECMTDLFKKSKLTQDEFIDLADITKSTLRNAIGNKSELRLSSLERACWQLGYKLELKITPL